MLPQNTPEHADRFLDAGLRGFIAATAKREYWRVAGVLDLEDLVQEGYLCYYKCYRRYSDPTNRNYPKDELTVSWMQAIVGRAFMNRIYDLAAKKRYGFAVNVSELMGVEESSEDFLDRALPVVPEVSTLRMLFALTPWELQELVRLLAGDGKEALGFKRKARGGTRETTNEYYCRLLGVSPAERNLVQELREYFE